MRPWLQLYRTDFVKLRELEKPHSGTCSPACLDSNAEGGGELAQQRVVLSQLVSLPSELMFSVCSLLDAEQLSALAQVCTHVLSYAYDPRHWRRIAMSTWPNETQSQLERRLYGYKSWRMLCIHRPRLRTSGIYMVRHQFSKMASLTACERPQAPVFLVTYYRFLRFYNDGTVISLVTPEVPHLAMHRVRREWKASPAERDKVSPSIGRYNFDEGTLQLVVSLPMHHSRHPDMHSGTVHMHLSLSSTKPGACDRLFVTEHYAIMNHEGGDFVPYDAQGLHRKPFRLIPILGFRSAVSRAFPIDDDNDLKQWYDMKRLARTLKKRPDGFTTHPPDASV